VVPLKPGNVFGNPHPQPFGVSLAVDDGGSHEHLAFGARIAADPDYGYGL
jgi:hypothetical protein